jgi:hypothetical protein
MERRRTAHEVVARSVFIAPGPGKLRDEVEWCSVVALLGARLLELRKYAVRISSDTKEQRHVSNNVMAV